MLFVLAMEALNSLISLAEREGLLVPLGNSGMHERPYLYADDVVLFLSPLQQDLIVTGAILELFGGAYGLHTNLDKCLISPIQCGLEDTVTLVRYFLGRLEPFPCKYLEIPLSTKKLRRNDLVPLVDKISDGLPT